MRRMIKLVGSEIMHVEYSGENEVILNVEVQDLCHVNTPMTDLQDALIKDGVRKMAARNIVGSIYNLIDQETIGDIIKQHIVGRDE